MRKRRHVRRADYSTIKHRTRQQEAVRLTQFHRAEFGPNEAQFLLDSNISIHTVRWVARLPDPNPFFDPPRRMIHGLVVFLIIGFYFAFIGGGLLGLSGAAERLCPAAPGMAFLGGIGAIALLMGSIIGGIWMMSTPEPFFILLGAKRIRQFAALSSHERQKRWKTYFPDKLPELASDWLLQIGERDLRRGYAVFAVANLIAIVLIVAVSLRCLA